MYTLINEIIDHEPDEVAVPAEDSAACHIINTKQDGSFWSSGKTVPPPLFHCGR
jgi:hypothetical protein